MAIFAILGAGMMGSAFALPLLDNGHEVHLIGTHLDEAIIGSLRQRSFHPTLKAELPRAVTPHPLAEIEAVLSRADAVVLGVSSAGVRWAAEQLRMHLKNRVPLAMLSKGLEYEEGRVWPLPMVLMKALGDLWIHGAAVAVSGPCIAGELVRRRPTQVVLSSPNSHEVPFWEKNLRTGYYVPKLVHDFVGAQVCAAAKNAFAMGMAFPAGLHERELDTPANANRQAPGSNHPVPGSIALHNLEAALFARSVAEMQQLVVLVGGKAETATGLCGVGDLHVTCNGGRTGRFGKLLGSGKTPAEATLEMRGTTLECLEVLATFRQILAGYEREEKIGPADFPWLRKLMRVALDGENVALDLALLV